jgi:hypothetical protein
MQDRRETTRQPASRSRVTGRGPVPDARRVVSRGNPRGDGRRRTEAPAPRLTPKVSPQRSCSVTSRQNGVSVQEERTARPHSVARRGRSEARCAARLVEATNGRRGADRSDAERLSTRSKPSQGGAPVGTQDPLRQAVRSGRATQGKTWRTHTWYRLQHAGSRERKKLPRW